MTQTQAPPAPGTRVGHFRVAHALSRRVRLKSTLLGDPAFDAVYFQALLEALPGVFEVRINGRGACLVVVHDGRPETWDKVAACLRSLPDEAFAPALCDEAPVTGSDVAVKALVTIASQALPWPARALLGWSMAMGVIVKGVETFFTRGLKVETLDATAISLALVRGRYFTAGSITTLLALGQYLEGQSEERSTALLKGLMRPQVEKVWTVRDGVEVQLPVGEIAPGDLVVCGAGELIPIDGVVAEGEGSVNQSSISGESVPVHIQPGDAVISGSVVEEGRLTITVERVGSETSMARIGRFIDQSLRGKSKTQTKSAALADKLVPVTLGLGGLMLLATRDVNRATSVLTVDFSCAVKLASPVAVRSGMYAAGQAGVLLKGAAALDALQDVDTIVFDKTGTLTTGRIAVTDIIPGEGLTETEVLALAAGAEEHYDHPVARAVVGEARRREIALPPISRVDFIVAHGVAASIDGKHVLVGSHHFVAEDEGVACDHLEQTAAALRGQGKSLLYVAREGRLAGLIALRDDPRPEAAAVLAALKASGIGHIVVLTGDHKDTAQALARALPQVDELHYELKPEDKAAIVARLKGEGRTLAFVGDGVNDAPALVTAHVGICMPKGADLAREAAQILLLHEDLHTLVVARQAAVRTNAIIRQTFGATIGCNSLIMLLATAGMSPVAAALLHNASTIGILGYAAMAASRPLAQRPLAGADAPRRKELC
ncbi:heavy metal translocating P-type ATPase [Solidesulfovibrio fructosivorans JJ]]|uniref:P-type Zn(2+) transporter n=1 Tax=Solidesulfovibrio fructosivorans JJ] TaxID=596151 RepID=E1JWZ3_SOLFR|nr:heavy metal translocating P-type ATPase [Solidesulfovibrio fructosivorans]EFL51197.1 heavy metal translocating P-type ATPase [Solidesulfovibrio fructosivorans JJ]]